MCVLCPEIVCRHSPENGFYGGRVFPQVKTMTVEWKERFLVSNFAKTIEKEIEN